VGDVRAKIVLDSVEVMEEDLSEPIPVDDFLGELSL
jgi:hypothetical protein